MSRTRDTGDGEASDATERAADGNAGEANGATGAASAGERVGGATVDRERKAARIRRLLETEGPAIGKNTRGFNEGRYESVGRLDDYEELKTRAREIKADAIERLPELIDSVRETVEANGGHVYLADDAADANRYVREVCERRDAERLVKSKSMTSEEIEVNDALTAAGVEVVETDLGEWVLQVADETPSHIVAPAIHKSREEIARLFTERFDPDEELATAEQLTAFARERLGELIADADVGMTGANFVTCDSGTIALVTSEGNARKTVGATDTQIAVAGVEKLVPSVEDLQPFVELIGRSGTGQEITSYISLLQPPLASPAVDFDADEPIGNNSLAGNDGVGESGEREQSDREFHLVLLDNGRMEMRDDEDLRETLYCIRCSACSNTCANFQAVGGHAFGGETYSGGIATGWEAGVHGMDAASEFNDLCTGCSRCVPACPVGIDIPWINTVVRDRLNAGDDQFDFLVDGLTPDAETDGPGVSKLDKRLFGNVGTLAKLGSAFAPLSNWVASSRPAGWLLERVAGVDSRRTLPAFSRTTFTEWAHANGYAPAGQHDASTDGQTANDEHRQVVVYPDLYTDHMTPARGKAAVRTLEALGAAVVVPDAPGSGRAPLSQGMIDTARASAESVIDRLAPYLAEGYDVVVIEPSDLAMFRGDYERLIDEESFDRLAAQSYDVLEYVYGLLANGASPDGLRAGGGDRVAYHSHCQARTMDVATYAEHVLRECGYEVTTTDVECCGMAGSFGYKTDYYELSMAVGDELAEQLAEIPTDHVAASGTSCCDQIEDLVADEPVHPVELLAPPE